MSTRLYETADGKYVDADAYDAGRRAGLSHAAEIANAQADMQAPDVRPGYNEQAHAVAVRIRDEIYAELAGTEVSR
jgi:hypothetical protein